MKQEAHGPHHSHEHETWSKQMSEVACISILINNYINVYINIVKILMHNIQPVLNFKNILHLRPGHRNDGTNNSESTLQSRVTTSTLVPGVLKKVIFKRPFLSTYTCTQCYTLNPNCGPIWLQRS